jgi:hypothetical protein
MYVQVQPPAVVIKSTMVHPPTPSETRAPEEQIPHPRRRGTLIVLLTGLGLALLAVALAVRQRSATTQPAQAVARSTDHPHDPSPSADSPAASETPSANRPARPAPDASATAEVVPSPPTAGEPSTADGGNPSSALLWNRLIDDLPVLASRDAIPQDGADWQKTIPPALSAWFERTATAGLRLGRVRLGSDQVQTFEGLGRLQVPFREGLVLRMHWINVSQFRLHAFHGTVGATLVYHNERPRGWAAYVTTRSPGEATPQTLALVRLADDAAPDRVNETGLVDLFFHQGRLVLAAGRRPLLVVPLPGPPTDLYVDGRAMARVLTLAKVGNLDADTATSAPFDQPSASGSETSLQPADRPWRIWQLAGSSKKEKKQSTAGSANKAPPGQRDPQRLSDGGLRWPPRLRTRPEAWFTPLPGDVPCRFDLHLEDVGAGCGIYLGDSEGRPVCLVRVVRGGKFQAVHWRNMNDPIEVSLSSWQDRPVALVGTSLWLRLVAGCGQVRFWISPDGQHWVEPHPAQAVGLLPAKTLGVHLAANVPTAGITLRKIVVRPLEHLVALAEDASPPPELSWSGGARPSQWLAWAEQQRPPGAEREAWYRRLALRTLAGGVPEPPGGALLEALLDDASGRRLPLELQVGALEEALLLVSDLRDGGVMQQGLAGRLMRLGLRAAESRDWGMCDRIAMIFERLPPRLPFFPPPDTYRLVRWQWIQVAYDDPDGRRWALKAWQPRGDLSQVSRLGAWALWQQARQAEFDKVPQDSASVAESWRDLLVEETDPEAFGIVAELQAAVQSAAWDDAARIVMRIEPRQAQALAACPWETGLWATVRQTVELACARFPPLREAIAQRYGAWGLEWVEQAIASGHDERVELATWQLAGTAAARRAHRWLADQALADGAFAEALRHYQAVADDPLQAAEVGPRRRLAAAFLGRDLGQPPTQPVVLGEQTFSPEAFEALVHEQRQKAMGAAVGSPGGQSAEWTLPPGKLEVRDLRLSVQVVAPLPAAPAGNLASSEGSWALRHLSSVSDGTRLVTSTRRQFVATDLATGKPLWIEPPADRLPQSSEFLGMPMPPVQAGDRTYVRWLAGAETQLLCLDRAGRVLWKWTPAPVVISDPVLLGEALVVLGLSRQPQRQLRVHAFTLDPLSGTVRRRSDLVLLREHWAARDCVLVSGDEDGLIAALGGVSLGLDPQGGLRWVRTHAAVPPEEDPLWVLQRFQPPLIHQERAYLIQPGVWTLDCLDRTSGQRHWQRVLPELVGLIGLIDETLVVHCLGEILGLSAHTGDLRWRYTQTGLLDGLVLGPHVLCFRQVEGGTGKLRRIEAVWLDGQTGAVVGKVPVPGLEGAAPAVGNLLPTPHGLAVWFQPDRHQTTAHLRLVRLEQPLPAGWRMPTPWEALAEEPTAP